LSLIPLLICIDVEPEQRANNAPLWIDWRGVTETLDFFDQQARPLLTRATGAPVNFSWFLRMDPQITKTYGTPSWVMARYGARLRALQAAGDEMGLHPHLWRWDETRQHWLTDFANGDWAEQCTRESVRAYQESFGQPCRSIRFGDRWLNNSIFNLLEELGVQYDLSAEPERKPQVLTEAFTGSMPDYTGMPRFPYQPARENFLQLGEPARPLWMIPVTTGELDWAVESFAAELPTQSAGEHSPSSPLDDGPTVTGNWCGWLDHADDEWISGWACATDDTDKLVAVDIFADATRLGRVQAGQFRPDLLAMGLGRGNHGFRYPVPQRLRDGQGHIIKAIFADTDIELSGSPKELFCATGQEHKHTNLTLDLGFETQIVCALFDTILRKKVAPHICLVARSDAAARRDCYVNLERTIAHIAAHPRATELRIVTPAAAITMIKEGSEL
jgi:hypothetical protein